MIHVSNVQVRHGMNHDYCSVYGVEIPMKDPLNPERAVTYCRLKGPQVVPMDEYTVGVTDAAVLLGMHKCST